MLCNKDIITCGNVNITIPCYKQIYRNEDTLINLTLYNESQLVDLDFVSYIQIYLYDTLPNKFIAEYVYPTETFTEINTTNWFENNEIQILQTKLPDTSDIFDDNDIILNKGKIAFLITKQISNYLIIGDIFVDIKFILNDEVKIIKCAKIGTLIDNKF